MNLPADCLGEIPPPDKTTIATYLDTLKNSFAWHGDAVDPLKRARNYVITRLSYHQGGDMAKHELIRASVQHIPSDRSMPVALERFSGRHDDSSAGSSSEQTRSMALNPLINMLISRDTPSYDAICRGKDTESRTVFSLTLNQPLSLLDLCLIGQAVNEFSPKYKVTSENCYFFAQTIFNFVQEEYDGTIDRMDEKVKIGTLIAGFKLVSESPPHNVIREVYTKLKYDFIESVANEIKNQALRMEIEALRKTIEERNKQHEKQLKERNEQLKEQLKERDKQLKEQLKECNEQLKEQLKERDKQLKEQLKERNEQLKEQLKECNKQLEEHNKQLSALMQENAGIQSHAGPSSAPAEDQATPAQSSLPASDDNASDDNHTCSKLLSHLLPCFRGGGH